MDPTLLLIHDDREEDVRFRMAIKEAAPNLGVLIARNREQVSTYPVPKLILLDLDLARTSALEMVEWLKSGQPWDRVPLIVLSSSQESTVVNRALELGANSCLLKPDIDDLHGVAKGISMYARLLPSQ